MKTGLQCAAFALVVGVQWSAMAQPGEEPKPPPEEGAETKEGGDAAAAAKPDEAKDKEKDEPKDGKAARSSTDPYEDPNEAYYFLSLRFRDVVVPKFMINIFADGGDTVNVFTFGPEFTRRKDDTEINVGLSYADYSMDEFLFKGKGDPEENWEIVSSDMKAIYLTVDILYNIPLDDGGRFALLIGGGVGFGGIFGNLYRNDARPKAGTTADPEDVDQWQKCAGPIGDTPAGTQFCTDDEGAYGDYDEPSWANGGSKPFIFPWLALPQISFRYKPIHQLQARADLGFSLTGFYWGLSAGYGF